MLTTILSVLIVLFVLLLFLAALMIFRATVYGRAPKPVERIELAAVEGPLVAEHLAAALRVPTVSALEHKNINYAAFDQLQAMLEHQYPRLHAALKREAINSYSLLYTWPGRAPELEPVLLCSHQDVVPCDPGAQDEWTYPPFSGTVADGVVWGRGALDMKSTLISVLEAVEGLIRAGYQPERTLYLAFGHDEEVGGWQGAACIADLLAQRGVKLAAALDEGGWVTEAMLPGVDLPVALVGLSEKGHTTVELRVEGRPGHSAMPPRHTAIGLLGRAIARVEAAPMPVNMTMARLMFAELGAFLPFNMRLGLANAWLLGGSVRKRLAAIPQTNALIRTTLAATMIQGGLKDNILPAQASALINCRLLPGDTRETVLAHLRKVINDEAVQITIHDEGSWEAPPLSPVDSPAYQSLVSTIRQVFPDVVVAPYLTPAASDARYYAALCPNVFRFSPFRLTSELLRGIHGNNERIPVEDLAGMVQFFTLLIKSWTTVVGTAE